jgi:hypothetical protein
MLLKGIVMTFIFFIFIYIYFSCSFDVDKWFGELEKKFPNWRAQTSLNNYFINRRVGSEIPRYLEDQIKKENVDLLDFVWPLILHELSKDDSFPLLENLLQYFISNSLTMTKWLFEKTKDLRLDMSKLSKDQFVMFKELVEFKETKTSNSRRNRKKKPNRSLECIENEKEKTSDSVPFKALLNLTWCRYGDLKKQHLVYHKILDYLVSFDFRINYTAYDFKGKPTQIVEMVQFLHQQQGLDLNFKNTIDENLKHMISYKCSRLFFEYVFAHWPLRSYDRFLNMILANRTPELIEIFHDKNVDFNRAKTKDIVGNVDIYCHIPLLYTLSTNETSIQAILDDIETHIALIKSPTEEFSGKFGSFYASHDTKESFLLREIHRHSHLFCIYFIFRQQPPIYRPIKIDSEQIQLEINRFSHIGMEHVRVFQKRTISCLFSFLLDDIINIVLEYYLPPKACLDNVDIVFKETMVSRREK